jgi:hypothetical protein
MPAQKDTLSQIVVCFVAFILVIRLIQVKTRVVSAIPCPLRTRGSSIGLAIGLVSYFLLWLDQGLLDFSHNYSNLGRKILPLFIVK